MIGWQRTIVMASLAFLFTVTGCVSVEQAETRGTGDLGLIIDREQGRAHVIEHSTNQQLSIINGFGDLSHASTVYSRDARYAYVFGRDGGLTKVDLLGGRIEKRVMQAGNSIGGAVSQDGRMVAVSNYEPGGVRVFDSDTLEMIADIPATGKSGSRSKVVGLVDAPQDRFVFSLYDTGEIWIADMSDQSNPVITRFEDVGKLPYDALLTPDGRYYIAGLFGEDGLVMLDLWRPERGVKRILSNYGRGERPLPVYKMPHLEGWAIAGNLAFIPAVGRHEVLVVDTNTWQEIHRIKVIGQPIFVMVQPDGRRAWVNFALPDNNNLQVIDCETLEVVDTLKPGPAVLHMEFTPRGEHVWVSVRDQNEVKVFDTDTLQEIASLPVNTPSGIFFTSRAHRIGL